MRKLDVIGIVISTDVDSLKLDDEKRDQVIESLLDIKEIHNVEHYSNFIIEAEFEECITDQQLINRIRSLRSQIDLTFKACGV